MLSRTGLINVDFTALRQVFQQRGGKTLFGLGVGDGENPAQAALEDLFDGCSEARQLPHQGGLSLHALFDFGGA